MSTKRMTRTTEKPTLGRGDLFSAEAEALVNNMIAPEHLHSPDGTSLNLNWPSRLTMISNNRAERIGIWPAATTPPGNNQYHHNATDPYSLIKLENAFSDIAWHLFTVVTETDIRTLPYDQEAVNVGRGWYLAKSGKDFSVSEIIVTIFGAIIRIPLPTKWVIVYGYSDEVAPQCFIFERIVADQEVRCKQPAEGSPGMDMVQTAG